MKPPSKTLFDDLYRALNSKHEGCLSMMKDSEVRKFSSEVLKPARGVVEDIAELGLDAIIGILADGSLLADIPVVKWFVAVGKLVSNFQAAFFVRKYSAFIRTMNNKISDDQIDALLDNLNRDPRILRKIIENILIDIDRYQTEQKAEMLSVVFLESFAKKKRFTQDEYNKIRFSIDLMHPFDGLSCLASYYQNRNKMKSTEDGEERKRLDMERVEFDFSPLAMTGFLKLPAGGMYLGSSGGASISDLGTKFYEILEDSFVFQD